MTTASKQRKPFADIHVAVFEQVRSKPGISWRELKEQLKDGSSALMGAVGTAVDDLLGAGFIAEDWPEGSPCTTYRAVAALLVVV